VYLVSEKNSRWQVNPNMADADFKNRSTAYFQLLVLLRCRAIGFKQWRDDYKTGNRNRTNSCFLFTSKIQDFAPRLSFVKVKQRLNQLRNCGDLTQDGMADPVLFEFLHAEIVKHIMEEKDEKTGKVKLFSPVNYPFCNFDVISSR
jgi:hypothetical protein